MTSAISNHARGKIRQMLARLFSLYASESHNEAVLAPHAQKPSRTGRAGPKGAAPEADLIFLREGKVEWKLYFLPGRTAAKKICENYTFAGDMILCSGSSGRVGFIEPRRFLNFLETESREISAKEIQEAREKLPQTSPPPASPQFDGIVIENAEFVPAHYSLRIEAGSVQKPSPGQFLQLMCDPNPHSASPRYRALNYAENRLPTLKGLELLSRRPFLRRPFSIASFDNGDGSNYKWLELVTWLKSNFEIIYKRNPDGPGTTALSRLKPGDSINVVGPLGKGYSLAVAPRNALLVGGGIGAPPLLFLAQELKRRGSEVRVFLGAVTKDKIPFRLSGAGDRVERFERLGLRPVICTDDGTAGRAALVTEPLIEYLERELVEPDSTRVFACGPRPLLAALDGIAQRFGVHCEALLEERMACGFGACISCVCPVKEPGQKMKFTRICTEGPAFDVKKVMWYA